MTKKRIAADIVFMIECMNAWNEIPDGSHKRDLDKLIADYHRAGKPAVPETGDIIRSHRQTGYSCPKCGKPMILNNRGHECSDITCDYQE